MGDSRQNLDDKMLPNTPRKGKGQRLRKPLTCCFLGGDEGARTLDPRLAKASRGLAGLLVSLSTGYAL